jgi:hypothetical protein
MAFGITREMLVVEGYVTTRVALVRAPCAAVQLKRLAVVWRLVVVGMPIRANAQADPEGVW